MARKSSSKATEEAVETTAEAVSEETATVETAETAVEEIAAETATVTEPLMYVGPTISGIGIQNRVYSEIPEGAKARFKEQPTLRNLFIPIAKYPTAEKQIREEKGYYYNAFVKALTLKN